MGGVTKGVGAEGGAGGRGVGREAVLQAMVWVAARGGRAGGVAESACGVKGWESEIQAPR